MLSLLMDVMIIAAMSIPNSFVYVSICNKSHASPFTNPPSSRYIQFHPLAYMVKLNIEMTMANLIKRIAISTSRKTGMASLAREFKSASNQSTSGGRTSCTNPHKSRGSIHELASFASYTVDTKATGDQDQHRVISFAPTGNQIKETREVIVHTEPNPYYECRGSEVEITAGHARRQSHGVTIEERGLGRPKSLESITEGNESMRSGTVPKRQVDDSDDEAALVQQKGWGWPRRPS
jgi:hypothetical protein